MDWSNPEAALKAMGIGQPVGLPMPSIGNAAQVSKDALRMSTSIFENYHQLRSILERHELVIQKRWMKKTKHQRRKILQSAWNGQMATTHRPDFAAFRQKGRNPIQTSDKKLRDAFLCPSINEEDLTKPRALLLFMNARGRHEPAEFSAADGEAQHLGKVSAAIMPLFLNEYVMIFTGAHDAKSYGKLLSWDDHPDAFNWMTTRKQPQPGEGLLILEAQQKILGFLVRCAKRILHDIPEDSMLEHELQPEPASVSENDSGFASLAVMALEAPYRVPAQLSFARVETLLQAQRDAAADHIWALREDPSYYRDLLLEVREHRQEMVPDTNGQPHPLFRFGREDVVWSRVVGGCLGNALLSFELLDELLRQSSALKEMQAKYAPNISLEKDLPEPYAKAILTFQHYLNQAAKGSLGLLKHHFAASPTLRTVFARRPEDNPNENRIALMQRAGAKLGTVEQQLLYLARILWEDDHDLFLARMPDVVDELQRLIDSEPKVREMISPWIAGVISDLAILSECLRQISLYQPWANSFEDMTVDHKDDIEKQYSRTSEPLGRILGALRGNESALVKLGSPANGRFHYPSEKRRSEENVKAMQTAEANLDALWSKVDDAIHRSLGSLDGLALKGLLTERILQRTPDWSPPNKSQTSTNADMLIKPLSELYFDLERRTEKTLEPSTSPKRGKLKEKTRGTPTTAVQTVVDAQDTTPEQTFKVDQKAFKVFKTLFYTSSVSGTPGDVSWTDFLYALNSVGLVPEKLYGSVWQFSPLNLDVERSIHFHEPHPNPKLPYRTARRYGRRLSRAYGWLSSTFSLPDKTGS